jgi:putative zinc- or iron-chelating protein
MKPNSTTRRCGSCSACCKLLPMRAGRETRAVTAAVASGMLSLAEARRAIPDFDKPAGQRCKYQKYGKGCGVYSTRPFGCRWWNCRWLLNDDTAELGRPDRSHFVIDIAPDFVETSGGDQIKVIQIWCDPDYPEAWRVPALLAYLERRGKEGYAALVRFDSDRAYFVCPPAMSEDGQWQIKDSHCSGREHTLAEKLGYG